MSSPIDFHKEAKKALELERVRELIDSQTSDPDFWDWLNSNRTPMALFFSIVKQLDQTEAASRLIARRQRLLWQYRTALECDREEPRSPVLTKMAEIGLHAAYDPPPRELVEE